MIGEAPIMPASASDESLHFVRAEGNDLFVVLTRPKATPRGTVVVLLQGGGQVPATHRNRMWVHLARRLAGVGYHVVRFDYHGVGESSGSVDEFRLDRPFVHDLQAVLDWLAERGLDSVILVGNCFGARTAIATANRVAGLTGVVAMTMPFCDYAASQGFERAAKARRNSWHRVAARAFRLNSWRRLRYSEQRQLVRRLLVTKIRTHRGERAESPQQRGKPGHGVTGIANSLSDLASRSVPLLLVYGDRDEHLSSYYRARESDLGPSLRREGVGLQILPGELIGYAEMSQQEAVMNLIIQWVMSTANRR